MSVVLVAFPGAPGISEEAQLKDQELNSFLEKKVQGIFLLAKNCCVRREIDNLNYLFRNIREKQ